MTAASGGRLHTAFVCAAGLMLGLGLQFKYVVLPETVLLCSGLLLLVFLRWVSWRQVFGHGLLLIVAGLIPTGLVILYCWSAGILRAFVEGQISAEAAFICFLPDTPPLLDWPPRGGPLFAPAVFGGRLSA